MIIERNIWEIRSGCMEEAVAILKAEADHYHSQVKTRLLQPVFAPFDQLIAEIQFDTQAGAEMFWGSWWESGAAAAFSQKFDPLTTGTGQREMWGVHEPVKLARSGKYANWRTTWPQSGKQNEILTLLTMTRGATNRYDILYSLYGRSNTVALKFEFDRFEDYLQEWADWGREQATPEFWQTWFQLAEPGGENEVWEFA